MNSPETHAIKLIQLKTLGNVVKNKIRDIRNESCVRKWMYTDHVIDVNEHNRWLNNLDKNESQIVFAIIDEFDDPLGIVSANNIDLLHKHTSWGLYLTQNARGGLGSAIEYHFINFVFESLNIEKLNCEVLDGNTSVVKLHKKFMFQIEGLRRSNIIKDNIRVDVHLLGLTKDEWVLNKEHIFEKYKKIISKFPISIKWNNE